MPSLPFPLPSSFSFRVRPSQQHYEIKHIILNAMQALGASLPQFLLEGVINATGAYFLKIYTPISTFLHSVPLVSF